MPPPARNGRTSRLLLSNLRLVSTHQPRRQSHSRRGQWHDSNARIGKLVAMGNLWGIPRLKRYQGQARCPPAHSCPKRQRAPDVRACKGGRRRRSLTTAWTDSRTRSLHGNAAPTRSARTPLSCDRARGRRGVLWEVTDLLQFPLAAGSGRLRPILRRSLGHAPRRPRGSRGRRRRSRAECCSSSPISCR